jgi:IclR family transcriptional regulator, acetate operon repressor
MNDDQLPAGILLTLRRGILALEVVARSKGEATARTIAPEIGVNLGTCYQLLRTLHERGYVSRLPGGRYALGSRIRFLLEHFDSQPSPPTELMDGLSDLHRRLSETTYLATWQNGEITLTASLEGTRALRVASIDVGYSGGAHARASCKAILAFVDEDTLAEYFEGRDLPSYTPHTITKLSDLLAELGETRARGYGIDREEVDLDVANVGAAVFGREGHPIAAYSVGLAAATLDARLDTVVPELLEVAEKASRALGYRGPYPPPSVPDRPD